MAEKVNVDHDRKVSEHTLYHSLLDAHADQASVLLWAMGS